MGIASLVIGLLAALLCFSEIGAIVAFIPGIIGCIFGFIGRKQCAVGGLVISLVATIISLLFFSVFASNFI